MSDFIEKLQGRRVDSKYSLVRKLGEGGFGAVYLGMHAANHRSVRRSHYL